MSSVARAYKTAVFTIHNPSGRKRAMLDDALKRNHLAYTKLLQKLLPMIDELAEVKAGKQRESAVYKVANPVVQSLPLSIGAKQTLINDVAGQLSSYIELQSEQDNPSPPTAARLSVTRAEWEDTLRQLAQARTLEEENAARDAWFRELKAGRSRPILFLKNRKGDGYLLLQHPETRRLYVWMNLHPKDSRFASTVKVKDLCDIRTGEIVSFSSKTGALFPLDFGRKHQEIRFLMEGKPQSAKLLKKDSGRYEVHVTFEFETEEIEPESWLGVDRGIYNLASLAVTDENGAIITRQHVDGRQLRHVQRQHERRQKKAQIAGRRYRSNSRRAMADEAIHVAANAIVDLALENRSQVVMENL